MVVTNKQLVMMINNAVLDGSSTLIYTVILLYKYEYIVFELMSVMFSQA